MRAIEAARLHVGAKAEVAVVRHGDRFVFGLESDHRQHRSENFLAGNLTAGIHVCKHGRFDEIAAREIATDASASRHESPLPLGNGTIDDSKNPVARLLVDDWTECRRAIEGRTDTELACHRHQHFDDLVVHGTLDEQARRQHAALARQAHRKEQRKRHLRFQYCVRKQEVRRFATEFEEDGLEHLRCRRHYAPRRPDAPRETDLAHAWVANERLARFRITGHDVQQAFRHAGFEREHT